MLSFFKIGLSHFQASLENMRVLRNSMENIRLKGVANFTSALSSAFEILSKVNESETDIQHLVISVCVV